MLVFFFFSSRRRHTRYWRDWSSDVCSSDLAELEAGRVAQLLVPDPVGQSARLVPEPAPGRRLDGPRAGRVAPLRVGFALDVAEQPGERVDRVLPRQGARLHLRVERGTAAGVNLGGEGGEARVQRWGVARGLL